MQQEPDIRAQLQKLCNSQSLAVLCTHGPAGPYGSLVAFATTEDLTEIFFATLRSTRKYANIMAEGKVALLIDNRCNSAADFSEATAATATGNVKEIAKVPEGRYLGLYLQKHPHLAEFVTDSACALLAVTVEKYVLVNQFQHVTELNPARASQTRGL